MMYLNSLNPDAFLCDKAKDLRSSISTFIHKVDVGHKLVPSGFYKKKDGHRNCVKEAMKWKESFSQLLSSKDGLAAFRNFLKTEFSEENLEFWVACEEYKKTPSTSKLPAKAQCIFQEFLQTGAPREVNIDHQTREQTRQKIALASRNCFDGAQEQTRILMEKDSYPRFLKSNIYQQLLAQSSIKKIKFSFT
ncbi:PREDICTED: regulator of G-protein signaling 16 [Nanorana parkeri]|uniref:regulator of G-protein signaling 16 n=1 Tax=Nanorana parkeri TaxID=125878 RepID=UPI0008544F79|nr:PREDICTED: regulator of G-protein signaling 16 [Nanorana parkeri]